MDVAVGLSTKKIFNGVILGVVLALIDFACGKTVAEHFLYKTRGMLTGSTRFVFGL